MPLLGTAIARHGNVASRVAFLVAGLPFLASELSMLVLFFFLSSKKAFRTPDTRRT